ncbi:MAG: hypothetical protein CMC38_05775 [Flavobacteriaceae bacterium]|nr:hypothetical protein [Flavobacteriaceae bacterium]|tara:strand:+ start:2349 stop:4187 length:1839 start_codon:yes stop_codon:yes gene_type:complete
MKNKILFLNISNNLWTFRVDSNQINRYLSDYIDINSKKIKSKYISFINTLSNHKIYGKNISEHFHLKSGYNIWWMSKIAEKSSYKSPQISDCIKLIALEEIILHNKCNKIILTVDNHKLIKSIRKLSKNLGIKIVINNYKFKYYLESIRRNIFHFYFFLNLVKGIVYLFLNFISVWFRTKPSSNWFKGDKSIMIFSYFIHLDLNKSKKGIFYSRQWELLPKLINSINVKCNWVHHFLTSEVARSPKQAINLLEKFNLSSNNRHTLLNSYLDFVIIRKIFVNYLYIIKKTIEISSIRNHFKFDKSSIDFWPLLMEDWYSSFVGATCIQNLIFIFQMDKIFKEMPYQKLGLYLNENQGWERAMLQSWRKHKHGKIIGVQHSSLRYWDLRYFDHKDILNSNGKFSQPKPDYIAVNGPIPLKIYLDAKYDKKSFIKVEAVRYLFHLNNSSKKNKSLIKNKCKKILILGNILKDSTIALLSLLSKIDFKDSIKFVIKAHPGALINEKKFPKLNLEANNTPLVDLLDEFDNCIAVGDTTAALDAYLSGLNLIVFLVNGELNLSPLKGFASVHFVRNSNQLKKVLDFNKNKSKQLNVIQSYYWLDKSLPKWKNLLNDFY